MRGEEEGENRLLCTCRAQEAAVLVDRFFPQCLVARREKKKRKRREKREERGEKRREKKEERKRESKKEKEEN